MHLDKEKIKVIAKDSLADIQWAKKLGGRGLTGKMGMYYCMDFESLSM